MRRPIHVTTYGDGDKIALLIHGLAGSSATWSELGSALVAKGYTVIAPDLTGHGLSPHEDEYSVDKWAEDLINLGIKPDLIIGHSIGGLVATKIQPVYKPKQTILLDPVFHLPALKFILNIARNTIRKSISDHTRNVIKKHTLTPSEALKAELDILNAWDANTVMALVRQPAIVRALLSGNHKTLIIRAHKSYIVPRRLAKKISSSISLFQFPSSHNNIHREYLETLCSVMHDFIASHDLNFDLAAQ